MRKTAWIAAALAVGITVTATPLQAKASQFSAVQIQIPNLPGNSDGVIGGIIIGGTGDTFPNISLPDCNLPGIEVPDIEVPDIEIPDTELPKPESPDVNLPDIGLPDINLPENNIPDNDTEQDNTQSAHAYVLRVVELVNEERAKAGLSPVTLQADVTAAAQVRAIESEKLFSHTRPDGTRFFTALQEAGVSYRGTGENIAWGQKTPEAVMNGWMNSEGHRANILNPQFKAIGVGYYQNAAGVNYWSQLFIY